MKIHIDMNSYFSNSFIAMDSENFYDIDPFYMKMEKEMKED